MADENELVCTCPEEPEWEVTVFVPPITRRERCDPHYDWRRRFTVKRVDPDCPLHGIGAVNRIFRRRLGLK